MRSKLPEISHSHPKQSVYNFLLHTPKIPSLTESLPHTKPSKDLSECTLTLPPTVSWSSLPLSLAPTTLPTSSSSCLPLNLARIPASGKTSPRLRTAQLRKSLCWLPSTVLAPIAPFLPTLQSPSMTLPPPFRVVSSTLVMARSSTRRLVASVFFFLSISQDISSSQQPSHH